MTVREAAKRWGLHLNTVMNLIYDNRIPGVVKESTRRNWRWLIPDDAVRPVRCRKSPVHTKGIPGRIVPSEATLDRCMAVIHGRRQRA